MIRRNISAHRQGRIKPRRIMTANFAQPAELQIGKMPDNGEGYRGGFPGAKAQFTLQLARQLFTQGRGGVTVRLIRRSAEQHQAHRAKIRHLLQRAVHGRAVAEGDSPHADIAPAARCSIDDFKLRLLPLERANVEAALGHAIVIAAGGGLDNLALQNQVEPHLAIAPAASTANPIIDKVALDGKTRSLSLPVAASFSVTVAPGAVAWEFTTRSVSPPTSPW